MSASHVTVRIPELPPVSEDHPLSPDDQLIICSAEDNVTRQTKLHALRTYLESGSNQPMQPVINGARVIYMVSASAANGTVAHIPGLAGQSFNLVRSGQPMVPETSPSGSTPAEYRILASGGFQLLTPGDKLWLGERFELDVYTLAGGSVISPSGGGGGSFLSGKVIVSTNFSMTAANHLGKLMQIRGGGTQITLTLPSIADIPPYTIIPIEAAVVNNYQQRIRTQGGQFIYMNGSSYTELFIAKGESLWLFRDDDGFVVMDNFGKIYQAVGRVDQGYSVEYDELLCNGSLYNRADYPRLWNKIQTYGSSLVSDTVWNTSSAVVNGVTVLRPYRGCYSTGDGSTTFRVPDLMDVTLKGVRSTTGSDPNRLLNKPGGFQAGQVGEFSFKLTGYLERKSGTSDNIYVLNQRIPQATPSDFDYTVNAGKVNTVPNVGILYKVKT